MADELRWGLLGTGAIARQFGADLRLDGRRLQAVGSRRLETAQQLAGDLGAPTAHGNYQSLVEDDDVDVVYVATPHPFHAEHALMALAAGKHVLVEKPFTLNAAEAERVSRAARTADRVVLEAMWTRFLPHMVRVRELIRDGAIGEPRAVLADHSQLLSSDPSGRLRDPGLGGGALLDLGVYLVSFAHDILGPPQQIEAVSSFTDTGVDQQTAMVLTHARGRSILHTVLDAAGVNSAVVIGTEGRIEIAPVWYAPTQFELRRPDGQVLESFDGRVPGRGLYFQARELEKLVKREMDSAVLPIAETIAVMTTLDAARRAIGLTYPQEPGPYGL